MSGEARDQRELYSTFNLQLPFLHYRTTSRRRQSNDENRVVISPPPGDELQNSRIGYEENVRGREPQTAVAGHGLQPDLSAHDQQRGPVMTGEPDADVPLVGGNDPATVPLSASASEPAPTTAADDTMGHAIRGRESHMNQATEERYQIPQRSERRVDVEFSLVTCVHGKLASESADFASFVIFKLDIRGSNRASNMRIIFRLRTLDGSHDHLQVLASAGSSGISSTIYSAESEHSGVWWSSTGQSTTCFLGVLMRRATQEKFMGTIEISLGLQSRMPGLGRMVRRFRNSSDKDIIFDPSAPPFGDLERIDIANLGLSARSILEKLETYETEMVEAGDAGAGGIPQLNHTMASSSSSVAHGALENAQQTTDQEASRTSERRPAANSTHIGSTRLVQVDGLHEIHSTSSQHGGTGDVPVEKLMKPLLPADTQPNVGRGIFTTLRTGSPAPQVIDLEDPPRGAVETEEILEWKSKRYQRIGVGCVRTRRTYVDENEVSFSGPFWEIFFMRKDSKHFAPGNVHGSMYIVIGIFHPDGFLSRERLLRLRKGSHSDAKIRSGIQKLRGWRGFLSLKSVSGFSLYERLELSQHNQHIMRDLYASYRSRKSNSMEPWRKWIEQNLNNGSTIPADGRYSIEVLTNWSVWRLGFITISPVALSLAIGFWYQATHEDGLEKAWVIATYIVAGAAIIGAFLGVATGLGRA